MAGLDVNLVVNRSFLTQPLLTGAIVPSGINLHAEAAKNVDATSRRLATLDFDVAEVEFSTFLYAVESQVPVVALPVFTSGRRFVQGGILWSTKAGIRDLRDLPGKAAATPQYWLSSSIWQRKILGMTYRVDPVDLSWVTLQPERLSMSVPPALLHRLDTAGRTAEELARTGSTHIVLAEDAPAAALSAGPRSPMLMRPQEPAYTPAFADRAAAERDYYELTGVFPILNLTVIRKELVEQEPWVVASLCAAYVEAKRLALAGGPSDATPPWMKDVDEDPWKYGVTANAKPLNGFLAAARAQNLIVSRYELDDLFAPGIPTDLQ